MKQLILKILIIGVPTYTVAFLSEKMVYTLPMLVLTALSVAHILKDSERVENRLDGDGSSSDSGIDAGSNLCW